MAIMTISLAGVGGGASPASDSPAQGRDSLWLAPKTERGGRIAWHWLADLVIVAAILRVVALNQQLWFDEIVTLLESARAPLARIVTTYDWQNQHMLYSILAHFSIRLFGEHPWSLRLPAVLFGIACVPALYFFARLVTTEGEALLASALMAVSYHPVWFSQNARGYTGMVLWTLLSSTLFIRGAREGRKKDWLLYAIVAALGIYTHLTMAFVLAGHGAVYLWLLVSRSRTLGRLPAKAFLPLYGFFGATFLSLALYAPVLSRIFARTIGVAGTSVRSDWASPLWAIRETIRGLRAGTGAGLVGILIGAVLLVAGLVSYWRRDRFLVGLMFFPEIFTAAAILATSHNLWPRFFFFEIGFGLLVLVRGIMVCTESAVKLSGGRAKLGLELGTVLVVLMILASLPMLRSAYLYPKQDFQGAMQFVEQARRPGEPVVTVDVVTMPFQRYYGRAWPRVDTRAELETAMSRDRPTWVIYAMPIFLRAAHPDLWETLQTDFQIVRVFPGTLAGGELYVCRTKRPENDRAVAR